jgi:hypothetical protein
LSFYLSFFPFLLFLSFSPQVRSDSTEVDEGNIYFYNFHYSPIGIENDDIMILYVVLIHQLVFLFFPLFPIFLFLSLFLSFSLLNTTHTHTHTRTHTAHGIYVRRGQMVRRIRESQEVARVIHFCLLGDKNTQNEGEKKGEGEGEGEAEAEVEVESNTQRARQHLHNWAQLVIGLVEIVK